MPDSVMSEDESSVDNVPVPEFTTSIIPIQISPEVKVEKQITQTQKCHTNGDRRSITNNFARNAFTDWMMAEIDQIPEKCFLSFQAEMFEVVMKYRKNNVPQ